MDFSKLIADLIKKIIDFITQNVSKSVSQPVKQIEYVPEQETAPKVEKPAPKKLTLKRTDFRDDGIFSVLLDDQGKQIAVTLEHSYDKKPKLFNGTFKCVRGPHRLHAMTADFITFEITGVTGHTNILFHWGNFNKDSEGCVLLGQELGLNGGAWMVTTSKITWTKFMEMMDGINEFELEVI